MQIQITNKDLTWVVQSSASLINSARLKVHLGDLWRANKEPEFVQTITIDAENFNIMMKAVSNIAQGEAKDINPALHQSMLAQIMPVFMPVKAHLDSLTDEVEIATYMADNAEILTIGKDVKAILDYNFQQMENKLLSGEETLNEWSK